MKTHAKLVSQGHTVLKQGLLPAHKPVQDILLILREQHFPHHVCQGLTNKHQTPLDVSRVNQAHLLEILVCPRVSCVWQAQCKQPVEPQCAPSAALATSAVLVMPSVPCVERSPRHSTRPTTVLPRDFPRPISALSGSPSRGSTRTTVLPQGHPLSRHQQTQQPAKKSKSMSKPYPVTRNASTP
jgi:hypothetical protein